MKQGLSFAGFKVQHFNRRTVEPFPRGIAASVVNDPAAVRRPCADVGDDTPTRPLRDLALHATHGRIEICRIDCHSSRIRAYQRHGAEYHKYRLAFHCWERWHPA